MTAQISRSNFRSRLASLLCACALLCLCSVAVAQTPPPATSVAAPAQPDVTRTLVVGVTSAPPFVIADGDGFRGLSIGLWTEVAADHHWKFRYKEFSLNDLLQAVSSGQVDVAIGAITATAEREKQMDFAHPITSSGLGIAVRNEHSAGWLAVAGALLSSAFLKVIGSLGLLLLIVGFLVWMAEHKSNPEQFGGSRSHGIFSGFWWAMVTMTTVGYGDVAPRSVPGRVLGLVWMLAALIVVSFFTASITAALTVGQLSNRVKSASDLGGMRVASVGTSTSAAWLTRNHMSFANSDDLNAALQALAANKTDAVVFDAPLLRWKIKQDFSGKLTVLPITLERQDYAFALPTNSPLREDIDFSLLKRINSPSWDKRLAKYFGSGR